MRCCDAIGHQSGFTLRFCRCGSGNRFWYAFCLASRWKWRLNVSTLNGQNLLPEPDRDRSLIEAYDDLARCLCSGGTDGQSDEWSIYDQSFRRLVTWAEEKGCFFEGLQPLKEGGREHDLTFVDLDQFLRSLGRFFCNSLMPWSVIWVPVLHIYSNAVQPLR